jgi:hypothetical protein
MNGKGFSGSSCTDCHEDAHGRQNQPWMGANGCLECHTLEAWPVTRFDHSKTKFALAGKHEALACAKCHTSKEAPRVPLKGLELTCAGCHEDPHRGQFLEKSQSRAECERCHTPKDWKETTFSHDKTRFPLDGKHQKVACAACHLPEQDSQGSFVRYAPLGIRCEDCHGSGKEE